MNIEFSRSSTPPLWVELQKARTPQKIQKILERNQENLVTLFAFMAKTPHQDKTFQKIKQFYFNQAREGKLGIEQIRRIHEAGGEKIFAVTIKLDSELRCLGNPLLLMASSQEFRRGFHYFDENVAVNLASLTFGAYTALQTFLLHGNSKKLEKLHYNELSSLLALANAYRFVSVKKVINQRVISKLLTVVLESTLEENMTHSLDKLNQWFPGVTFGKGDERYHLKIIIERSRPTWRKDYTPLFDWLIALRSRNKEFCFHVVARIALEAPLMEFILRGGSFIRTLDLETNPHVTEKLMNSIGKFCPKIRFLNLKGCKLQDSSIFYLKRNKELKHLSLASNPALSSFCLEYIVGLPLESLNLAFTAQKSLLRYDHNTHYGQIGKIKTLRILNLAGLSQLTSSSLISIFKHCLFLQDVDLSHCNRLDDTAFKSLALLKNPKRMILKDCQNITGSGFDTIALTLTTLDLSQCPKVTIKIFPALLKHQNLFELNLSGWVEISDDTSKALTNLKKLRTLSLYGCPKLTHKGVELIQKALPKTELQCVKFNKCETFIAYLKEEFPSIDFNNSKENSSLTITLDVSSQINEKTLLTIIEFSIQYPKICFKGEFRNASHDEGSSILKPFLEAVGPAIETLDVQGNAFDYKFLEAMLQCCPKLKSLNLAKSQSLSILCIWKLASLKSLQHLDLSGNPSITDEAVNSLSKLPLKTFSLSQCQNISVNALKSLSKMKSLEKIVLDGCTQLNPLNINILREHLPKAKILYTSPNKPKSSL